ncbi:MAG TPA: formate dehydrogenase accessory sulfurtransferase FdhD, partial [Polyangiaceae bacterium]
MMSQVAATQTLRSESGKSLAERADELSVEEPLEIRISGDPLAVTMRTPGNDHELVAGFLLAEGLIQSRNDLGTLRHCGHLGDEAFGNAIDVLPAPGTVLDVEALGHARRGTLTTSGCGMCGRTLIDDLVARLLPVPNGARFERAFIAGLTDALRAEQPTFARTGGLHAAGIALPDTGLCVVREDVGRHNAVDKVIGRMLLDGRSSLHEAALVVSGRTSFEIVQKAL